MSATTALPTTPQETKSPRRPNPLLSVMGWELRRFFVSRLFWIQAACYFLLTCLVVWVGQAVTRFTIGDNSFSGFIAGTSVWGLLETLPTIYLTLLALLLPFINTEGVSRDLNRRTHELLMTTALPNWAYIWGRYLVGLLMSLGLAVLMLFAILGMGYVLHLTVADYPLPPTDGVIPLWIGMVLTATVLISSLSFMLGTLFPRRANLVKIAMLVGWIIGAVVIPPSGDSRDALPNWYINWDPTSAATGHGLLLKSHAAYSQQPLGPLLNPSNSVSALPGPTVSLTPAQWAHLILTAENKPVDLAGWFIPHLLIGGLSLLLVVIAAIAFQRFRNTFGA